MSDAALKRVASGEPCRTANTAARTLRSRLNELFENRDWPWVAYGDFSMVRLVPNYRGERPRSDAGDNDGLVPFGGDLAALDGPKNMRDVYAMRQAMLLNPINQRVENYRLLKHHTDFLTKETKDKSDFRRDMLTANVAESHVFEKCLRPSDRLVDQVINDGVFADLEIVADGASFAPGDDGPHAERFEGVNVSTVVHKCRRQFVAGFFG